jgi:hypothetical protein
MNKPEVKMKTLEQRKVELAAKRAEVMRKIVLIGQPPKPPAQVVEFPPKLSEAELWRRQLVIDAAWERTNAARRELEAARSRGFHKGYGDPDY